MADVSAPVVPAATDSTVPEVRSLAELVALVASGDPWSPRLYGQLELPSVGEQQGSPGDTVGVFVVQSDDVEHVALAIARRCGIGDDGQPQAVRVVLRGTRADKKVTRWVNFRLGKAVVADMLASALPASPAAATGEIAALRAELERLRAQHAVPARHAVVDQSPFALAQQMMEFQMTMQRAMREEMRASSPPPSSTALAPVEVYQKLGELTARVDLASKGGEGGGITGQGIAAVLGVLPLAELGSAIKSIVETRRDESQMRLAIWAKANGLAGALTSGDEEKSE